MCTRHASERDSKLASVDTVVGHRSWLQRSYSSSSGVSKRLIPVWIDSSNTLLQVRAKQLWAECGLRFLTSQAENVPPLCRGDSGSGAPEARTGMDAFERQNEENPPNREGGRVGESQRKASSVPHRQSSLRPD